MLLCLLSGCQAIPDKTGAERAISQLHVAYNAKEYDKAMSFYGSQFFEKTPKEKWRKQLEAIRGKLGEWKSADLTGMKWRTFVGTDGSGTYWDLTYDSKFANSPAKENFTVFCPSNSSDCQILGHGISSDRF